MKKIKVIMLAVFVIVALFMLASCAAGPEKFYNMDFKNDANVISTVKELSDLEGYSLGSSNEYVACFTKVVDDVKLYKVIDLKTGKIISTYEESAGIGYSISAKYSNYAYLVTEFDIADDLHVLSPK